MRFERLFFALGLTFCALAFAGEPSTTSVQTWSYKDFAGETKVVTLDEKNSLKVSDFNQSVALAEELDAGRTSGELKAGVTADNGQYPVYSVSLSKDASAVAEVRDYMDKMHEKGAISFTADELCPATSERVMTILLRDVPIPFTFCLQKLKRPRTSRASLHQEQRTEVRQPRS